MGAASHLRAVARYYDRNTRRFLRFGKGKEVGAIHRPVWAPGVRTQEEAVRYVERRIAEALGRLIPRAAFAQEMPPLVMDLGCGVGSTAQAVARELPVRVAGITLSRVQAAIARRQSGNGETRGRLAFLVGDFLQLPVLPPAAAAYAVEAFVHAADARAFFREISARLQPEGVLLLCDDFLAAPPSALPPAARNWLRRFQVGWQAPSLLAHSEVQELAAREGLRPLFSEDLTPFLHLYPRVGLEFMKLITSVALPSVYWRSHVGGTALQECLRRGWVQYRFLGFRRERTVC